MFSAAFNEYKNEGVFIKLMEEVQSIEQSYFKSECYDIPENCEKIDEAKFRKMLKDSRILYFATSDYDFAVKLFHNAFGCEKKYRYFKDKIDNIKNFLYAKVIDWIMRDNIPDEIPDDDEIYNISYRDKMSAIMEFLHEDIFLEKSLKECNMSDEDIGTSDLLDPAYKDEFLPIIENIENKAVSPLTNEETIAICNYKLWEIDCKYKGIFDYEKFKSKQNTFSNFKEIVNLLSFDYYFDCVQEFIKDDNCLNKKILSKLEGILSTLPIDKIWDCVIVDIIINSYIDISLWNDGRQFQCSFKDLYSKFNDKFIHYTSSSKDEDIPLIKEFISDEIQLNSQVKALARLKSTVTEIDISGYIYNFFSNIPPKMKNTKSKETPEFSMPMIFALLMYKYSFGRFKSPAPEISIEKLCECINCYTKMTSRYTFAQEIDKRDIYEAQCFIEKYLLNLIYNVNCIGKYLNCNFATDKLRESYRLHLKRNEHILTYQMLCSLQKDIDVNIIYFMAKSIMDEYTNIITYILASIKASSIDSYQKIINSFKLYLINDRQSHKDIILSEISMKDISCNFSPSDYAGIFGFDYSRIAEKNKGKRHPKKRKDEDILDFSDIGAYLKKLRENRKKNNK